MRRGRRPRSTAGGLPALLSAALLLPACAGPATGTPASAAAPQGGAAIPVQLAIRWTRTAAEHRAAFRQTYAWSEARVEARAADLKPERWAVILDADETVLDNSAYQLRRADQGLGYTPESWTAWVMEEAAPALPGAVAFTDRVRTLGGRVAIVTNRKDHECDATRRNLEAVGVKADAVLCRTGEGAKDRRFRMVQEGTTPAGLPPLEVVAWVGDNIGDFPGGTQEAGADEAFLSEFGTRYFVLPNPMYGSWEDNPVR